MLEIAIDIGGTFTDIVCLQDQQRLCLTKVPTTPYDLVQGVRQGVARVLALAGQERVQARGHHGLHEDVEVSVVRVEAATAGRADGDVDDGGPRRC